MLHGEAVCSLLCAHRDWGIYQATAARKRFWLAAPAMIQDDPRCMRQCGNELFCVLENVQNVYCAVVQTQISVPSNRLKDIESTVVANWNSLALCLLSRCTSPVCVDRQVCATCVQQKNPVHVQRLPGASWLKRVRVTCASLVLSLSNLNQGNEGFWWYPSLQYPVWTGHKLCPRGIHSGCSEFAKHTQSFAIMISPPQSQLLCPPVPQSVTTFPPFMSRSSYLRLLCWVPTLSAPSMTGVSWLLTVQVSSLQALPQGLVKIFTAPANHLYVVACTPRSKLLNWILDPEQIRTTWSRRYFMKVQDTSFERSSQISRYLSPAALDNAWCNNMPRAGLGPAPVSTTQRHNATQRASGLIPPAFADSKKTSRQNRHVPCDRMTRCIAALPMLPMPRRPCCGSLH